MNTRPTNHTILLVEDDPDDIYLISEAINECRLNAQVNIVQDGEEMFEYLRHQGSFSDATQWPRPDLILLDLNMPRKDGREVLAEIKQDPQLRSIPVVVLTTSQAEEDLEQTYASGASGFITKPVGFGDLRQAVCNIGTYWLETVTLPDDKPSKPRA